MFFENEKGPLYYIKKKPYSSAGLKINRLYSSIKNHTHYITYKVYSPEMQIQAILHFTSFCKVINNYRRHRRPSIIIGFGLHVKQLTSFVSVCVLFCSFPLGMCGRDWTTRKLEWKRSGIEELLKLPLPYNTHRENMASKTEGRKPVTQSHSALF